MRAVRHTICAVAALVTVGSSAAAQTDQPRALVITAQNLMAGDARHQALARSGGDPNALMAGDVVLYRLVFTNVTEERVRNIEFTDPVPTGLRYVGGSAASDRDDVIVEYSIDGGATYVAQPMIEQIVNGRRVEQPAPPERFTDIRWRILGWVEPGAQVTAEFRASFPEPAQFEAAGQGVDIRVPSVTDGEER